MNKYDDSINFDDSDEDLEDLWAIEDDLLFDEPTKGDDLAVGVSDLQIAASRCPTPISNPSPRGEILVGVLGK